jgi:phosphoribosylformylglycinamidine cyclo-ligase
VHIEPRSWEIPKLFRLIQEAGRVDLEEMRRVFNLGIGMVVIVSSDQADHLQRQIPDAVRIGTVVDGKCQVQFLD